MNNVEINQQLLTALKRLLEGYKKADHTTGYCCCGTQMDVYSPPNCSGHCAVDFGVYQACLVVKDTEAIIATVEAAQPVCQTCKGSGYIGDFLTLAHDCPDCQQPTQKERKQ